MRQSYTAGASKDVLIVGGGPAGLAAAIAARLKGFCVTVLEPAVPPIDKACGEGLLPAGVEALRRLGLRISNADGLPFRGIRFVENRASFEATFSSGCGLGIRRTSLHEILATRASEIGVRLLWGSRRHAADPLPAARWIVGADGHNSLVRRAAGLDAATGESVRFGFRRHFRLSPWTDFVEVHWGRQCQIYITPVARDEIGLAVLSRDPHLRLDDALRQFPELHDRLACAEPSNPERGALTTSRRLRRVFHGNTVLVGEASGSVDAITGEGLSLAFQHALALADALATGDLDSYQTAHRRLAWRPAAVARMLLLLDRFPALRRGVFCVLNSRPAIFATLLTKCSAPNLRPADSAPASC